MLNNKVFLATDWNGISRAHYDKNRWRVETLLPDHAVKRFAKDPVDPNRLYGATKQHGVIRSDDRGITWQTIGLDDVPVMSVAVDPNNPDILYAGSKPVSLYVSRDAGKSWQELPALRAARKWWWFSPADPPGIAPYVMAVAVSPGNPDVIACGIELGGLLVSEDGGKSWSGHKKNAIRDCHSLKWHSSDPNWVYEGGAGGVGAAYSRDGGKNWMRSKGGLFPLYGWTVAGDPERPEVRYHSASRNPNLLKGEFTPPAHNDGSAGASIYRSIGGAAPEKLGGGLPDPLNYMAYALESDPNAPGHLYAGMANGEVWHTVDYGDTWAQLPFNLKAIHAEMIILG